MPVSKLPLLAVAECPVGPSLVHVTVSPTTTVTVAGVKSKSLMVTLAVSAAWAFTRLEALTFCLLRRLGLCLGLDEHLVRRVRRGGRGRVRGGLPARGAARQRARGLEPARSRSRPPVVTSLGVRRVLGNALIGRRDRLGGSAGSAASSAGAAGVGGSSEANSEPGSTSAATTA